MFYNLVSDNESEHDNEEEEWEAQQIRKGVTGAQVRHTTQFVKINWNLLHGAFLRYTISCNMYRLQQHSKILCYNSSIRWV